VVRAVAGVEAPAATDAVAELHDAGLVARSSALRFEHPIIRAAIHDEIPLVRRRALHGLAARELRRLGAAPEVVGHHLLASEPAGEEWVVSVLRRVAEAARGQGAAQSAVPLLARALEEPPSPSLRATVLAELGEAELAGGEAERAAAHLREALEAETPPERP